MVCIIAGKPNPHYLPVSGNRVSGVPVRGFVCMLCQDGLLSGPRKSSLFRGKKSSAYVICAWLIVIYVSLL